VTRFSGTPIERSKLRARSALDFEGNTPVTASIAILLLFARHCYRHARQTKSSR
jgi:hypothetical protein